MIWFILVYIITPILYGVVIYIDMEKGETLQEYVDKTGLFALVFFVITPIVNTCILIFFTTFKLSEKVWNKIKYWKK